MVRVGLSLDFIVRIKQHIKLIMWNLQSLDHVEYDLGKAGILQNEINNLQQMLDAFRTITNNPEKYIVDSK